MASPQRKSAFNSLVALSMFLSVALGVPSVAHAQTAREKLDIAGIKFGMTEAEAEAAIKAFEPNATITREVGFFNYSDGVTQHQTPDYLDTLFARLDQHGSKAIRIYFSGTGGEAHVIGVTRKEYGGPANPPTAAQFQQGLVEKYGQPAGFTQGQAYHPVWEEKDRPSCIRVMRNGKKVVDSRPFDRITAADQLLFSVEEELTRRGQRMAKDLMPDDLASCGAFITYNAGSADPVRDFTAAMYDVGAFITTERARAEWVEKLKAKALKKRESQGETPKF